MGDPWDPWQSKAGPLEAQGCLPAVPLFSNLESRLLRTPCHNGKDDESAGAQTMGNGRRRRAPESAWAVIATTMIEPPASV